MKRLTPIAACALAGVWLAAGPLSAGAQEDPAPEAKAGPEADSAGAAPRPGAPGRNLWWNEPDIVDELELSDAQRKEMDTDLDSWRKTAREEKPVSFAGFNRALAEGDWDAARAELDRIATQAAAPLRSRGELKLELLSGLSAAQLEKLVESHPRIVHQPLIPGGRRGAGERRGGGKAMRGKPPAE